MPDEKPKKPPRKTKAEIRAAIVANQGRLSFAAVQLGMSYDAIQKRVEDDEDLQLAKAQCTDRMVDIAEANLMKLVAAGNFKAIRYILDTFGVSRGYGRRPEPAEQTNVTVNLAGMLPMERLEQIIDNYRNQKVIEIEDAIKPDQPLRLPPLDPKDEPEERPGD